MAYESALNKFLDNLPSVAMEMRRQNIQKEQADKRLALERQQQIDLDDYRDSQIQNQKDQFEFLKKKDDYEKLKSGDEAFIEALKDMNFSDSKKMLKFWNPETPYGMSAKEAWKEKSAIKATNTNNFRNELNAFGFDTAEVDRAVGMYGRGNETQANKYVNNLFKTKYNIHEWSDTKTAHFEIAKLELESAMEKATLHPNDPNVQAGVMTAQTNLHNIINPPKEELGGGRTKVGTFKASEVAESDLIIGDEIIDANNVSYVVSGVDESGNVRVELKDKEVLPMAQPQVTKALRERRLLAKHGRSTSKYKWLDDLAQKVGLERAEQLETKKGKKALKEYFTPKDDSGFPVRDIGLSLDYIPDGTTLDDVQISDEQILNDFLSIDADTVNWE